MELLEAIKKRRSVRKFTDYYVTDNEIKEILEAARLAPSWANTQPWEFIIVRDGETIKEITGTYSKTNPAKSCSETASALIVVCAKTKVSGFKDGQMRTKFPDWFMFDIGLAVQNLSLRAHDLGLGSVIVGSLDHDACKKIVQLPDGYEIVAVLPIGKPLDKDKEGPKKKELKEFVHLNVYGERFTHIY